MKNFLNNKSIAHNKSHEITSNDEVNFNEKIFVQLQRVNMCKITLMMESYERNNSSLSLNDKIHVKIDQITPLYDTIFATIKRVLKYTYDNVLGFYKIT